jgi:hypothetical protein
MRLAVGNVIHFAATGEEGRIVRIVKIEGRTAYIVTTLNKSSGTEIEALWRPQELKEFWDRAPKRRNT